MYAGEVLLSAVDENGNYQVDKLEVGDIWYFPKGSAHTIQGLADENEYLLVFDDGEFYFLTATSFSSSSSRKFRSIRVCSAFLSLVLIFFTNKQQDNVHGR